MTVGKLIQKLSKLDQGLLVVLSADAEGNSFSKLAELGDGMEFMPGWTGGGRGEVSETQNGVTDGAEACVVLWPV